MIKVDQCQFSLSSVLILIRSFEFSRGKTGHAYASLSNCLCLASIYDFFYFKDEPNELTEMIDEYTSLHEVELLVE